MMKAGFGMMQTLSSLLAGYNGPSFGRRNYERREFGVPMDQPLRLRRCDPSQHNTLRHDQVERKRKQRNRAGRKPNKPYVKQYA